MASPPTPYPTTTLSLTNPVTGERQLRRTPVGLRRMYDDDATISTGDFSTDTRKSRRWPFWCVFCLLFLLLFFLAGAGVGIYFAVSKPKNVVLPQVATTTATGTTPSMICKSTDINLDIYVLMDISAGLSAPEYLEMRNFLAMKFFNQFNISLTQANASRMALMAYDQYPNGVFKFNSISSTALMVSLVNNTRQAVDQSRFVVNLGKALAGTTQMSAGSRPTAKKVMLVFISMNSTDDAVSVAKIFQDKGYIIVTVALGGLSIDMNGVASGPQYQFKVTDLAQFNEVHNSLMNALCDAQKT